MAHGYKSNPELIFLKWAYKTGALDDDQLHEFNTRYAAEGAGRSRLELLVEWELLDQPAIDALLGPERIAQGLRDGLIDEANAASLRELLECG